MPYNSSVFSCYRGKLSRQLLVLPCGVLIEPHRGESIFDNGIDDLADGVLPIQALRYLLTDLLIIKSCARHLSLQDVSGEITHGRLL